MKLVMHDCYLKAENYTIKEYTDEYYDYLYDKYEQKADCTECNVFVGISWELWG